MNILEFFEQSVGKWFSQRTSYHLAQTEQWHQSDKTDIFIELLAPDAPTVLTFCQAQGLNPSHAVAGLQTQWNKSLLKPSGTMLMVAIADSTDAPSGQLIASLKTPGASAHAGRYVMNPDQSLTLITETPGIYSEERLWFVTPNLRLRTSLMKQQSDGFQTSSFYSEIRMASPAPDPTNAPTAA